ncbi:MAG: hypothetical protein RL458_2125, partial [Pseudomonadota bacterium]
LELVDRVIVLDQGKVVADGPRDKVLGAGGGSTSGGASAPAGPRGPSGPDGLPGRAGGDSPAAVAPSQKTVVSPPAGSALRGALSARPFGAPASGGGGLQVVVPSTPATGQPTGRSVTSETSASGLSGSGPDSSSTKAG